MYMMYYDDIPISSGKMQRGTAGDVLVVWVGSSLQ